MAANDQKRRGVIAELNKKRLELIAAGVSPFAIPQIRDDMAEQDIVGIKERMDRMGGMNPKVVNRFGVARNPDAGAVVQRTSPATTPAAGSPQAQEAAGVMSGIADNIGAALGAPTQPIPRMSPAEQPVAQAPQPGNAALQAIAQMRPDLANADIQMTPAGASVMMEADSGPRRVLMPMTPEMSMLAALGPEYANMTPQERAAALTERMPTAPQRGTTVGAPGAVYSDELGRDRNSMNSLPGQRKMGTGTMNPDGTFSAINEDLRDRKGRELLDENGNSVGREVAIDPRYLAPGDSPVARRSGPPIPSQAGPAAQIAAGQVPRARVVKPAANPVGPVEAIVQAGVDAPAVNPTVAPAGAAPAAVPQAEFVGPPTPDQMIQQAQAEAAAGAQESAAKDTALRETVKGRRETQDKVDAAKKIKAEAEIKRQKDERLRNQHGDPSSQIMDGIGGMMGSATPAPTGGAVASLGQDNRGTGNGRAVAPTPLGLTMTKNDVVDSFARNPQEDAMKKRLESSGFGTMA